MEGPDSRATRWDMLLSPRTVCDVVCLRILTSGTCCILAAAWEGKGGRERERESGGHSSRTRPLAGLPLPVPVPVPRHCRRPARPINTSHTASINTLHHRHRRDTTRASSRVVPSGLALPAFKCSLMEPDLSSLPHRPHSLRWFGVAVQLQVLQLSKQPR